MARPSGNGKNGMTPEETSEKEMMACLLNSTHPMSRPPTIHIILIPPLGRARRIPRTRHPGPHMQRHARVARLEDMLPALRGRERLPHEPESPFLDAGPVAAAREGFDVVVHPVDQRGFGVEAPAVGGLVGDQDGTLSAGAGVLDAGFCGRGGAGGAM